MAGYPTTKDRADRPGDDVRSLARDLKMTVKQATARAGLVGTTSRQAHEIIKRTRRAARPPDDDATLLARQAKKWHMDQGDRLPFEQCKRIIAALQDCPGWTALVQRSSARLRLDDALLSAIARLKQFGYTAQAATALIGFLIGRDDADGSKVKGATRGSAC